MRIGNSNSLLASRNLGETSKAISRALERLSTGKRVNSPSDGAADYSASLSLDSQIRGISQINLGLNRAMGMLQVADSAMSSQLDTLQRMREIAVEGANGTLDSATRKTLNSELQSLLEEFNRITQSTEFDGQKLLDGAIGNTSLNLDESSSMSLEFADTQLTEAFKQTIGTGAFETRVTVGVGNVGANQEQLESADLDGDGNADIVVYEETDNTVGVLMGNGDGSFGARKTYNAGTDGNVVQLVDVTGDGIVDILTGDGTDDTVSILEGNGDGSFAARTTLSAGNRVLGLWVEDFNGDGIEDIATTDADDNTVSVFIGNGDGSFKARTTYTTGTYTVEVRSADLNNDGYADLVAVDRNSSSLSVLLGNGDGSFEARVALTTGLFPSSIAMADYDGDGDIDIVSSNYNDDEIRYFEGNGDGTFVAGVDTTTGAGSGPTQVRAADVNGDGVMDVIADLRDIDGLGVLLGNGDGTFQSVVSYAVGAYPTSINVNDFNNDGVQDVLVKDATDDDLSIFIGKTQSVAAVSKVNVDDEDAAQDLIGILDSSIETIVGERASLATAYERLDLAQVANLTQQESLSSAKSLIEDADFAIETAELVKNQVLQQAQVAVQAQANVQLQVVLGLLN